MVSSVRVDLSAPDAEIDGEEFHLRCTPALARERLQQLAGLGFDDVILTRGDQREYSAEELAAVRALVPN
jgi:hypothetical protein